MNIQVQVAVPHPIEANSMTRQLFGDKAFSAITFIPSATDKNITAFPRPIDVGTLHFAIATQNIHKSITALQQNPAVNVLGEVQLIESGPLATFRWCWLRMDWGSYFEVQQWGTHDPRSENSLTLHREREIDETAAIPSLGGVDHIGFVVTDLAAIIQLATTAWAGTKILETQITAEENFMKAQFELPIRVNMKMAMIRIGNTNLEFFEHTIVNGLEDEPQKIHTPEPDAPGAATLIIPHASQKSIEQAHQLGLNIGTAA